MIKYEEYMYMYNKIYGYTIALYHESSVVLFQAVECKNVECVMLLLQHTADVDTRDRNGDTAVHVAVDNSFTAILRLLIKSGADINIKNKVCNSFIFINP